MKENKYNIIDGATVDDKTLYERISATLDL